MNAGVVEVEDTVPALATAAAETAERTEKRRRRWGCLVSGAVALLIPTLIVGGVGFWFVLQDQFLAHEALARARTAGDPLTEEEFQAAFYPPSPEIDEATRRWNQVLIAYGRSESFSEQLPDTGLLGMPVGGGAPTVDERGLYAEPTLSTVNRYFASGSAKTIAAIHEARRADAAPRIACDLSGEQELALPDGWFLYTTPQLLVLEAERQAAHGDLEATTEALLSMIATSDAQAGDASMPGIGCRAQSYRWACLSIRRMIERVDLSDAQLARLDEELAQADFREALVRHFQAEQYRVIRVIESSEPTGDEELDLYRKFPLRGADKAMAIDCFQEMLDGARVDLTRAEAACDRVCTRMDVAEHTIEKVHYAIAILRVREADTRVCLVLQAEADRRLTRALIACERYRLKHGMWPADLKALVPEFLDEVPQDVLGGEPVRCVVEGNRLKLGSTVSEDWSLVYPPGVSKGPVELKIEKPKGASTDAATP